MSLVSPDIIRRYTEAGWWGTETVGDLVAARAASAPDRDAYVTPTHRMSWSQYHLLADRVAGVLTHLGLAPGDRVAVWLPDGPAIHAVLVGTERAGVVAMGIGARAGDAELAHLLGRTGARVLVTAAEHRGRDVGTLLTDLTARGVALDLAVVVDDTEVQQILGVGGRHPSPRSVPEAASPPADRALGPNDLWALNSTSGTTGMPKCVTQFQNRWIYFARLAAEAGGYGADDVILGAVPTPFGFGLWTSHFAAAVTGCTTVVLPRYDTDEMIRMIEQERVTILACVSTQFRMLLTAPSSNAADLTSLRCMFTGGEAIPYDRAAEFEERTGAEVLQFFGSNETGAFSYTRLGDDREHRIATAGRVIPEMHVKLFDETFQDVTTDGGPGQPGGIGPLTCAGYYDDPEANAELYAPDGSMLMGDYVTIDDEGWIRVVGRKSDLIIRGGKNISAPQVEAEVETHPAVDLVSVVAVPDDTYGEKVCAVVTLRPGASLDLAGLSTHLAGRAFSRELHPEHLVVVDDMPQSSGGKMAKGAIRTLATERLATGH